jgi:hypothetical protein
MNESLNQMIEEQSEGVPSFDVDSNESESVDESTPLADSIPDQDESAIPEADAAPEGDEVVAEEPAEQTPAIGFVPLADWFDLNVHRFETISPVRLQIRGVNPKETLVVTVPDASGENAEDGHPKRNLEFIKDANTRPVLALDGRDMEIYSSGFKIIYDYIPGQIMKCYGSKAGMVVTFCVEANGMNVPYAMLRAKSKDKGIDPVEMDTRGVGDFLPQPLDKEAFVLLYKQSAKVIDTLTTNEDAIKWLLERQETITDNNHHIQIDNVIVTMLGL